MKDFQNTDKLKKLRKLYYDVIRKNEPGDVVVINDSMTLNRIKDENNKIKYVAWSRTWPTVYKDNKAQGVLDKYISNNTNMKGCVVSYCNWLYSKINSIDNILDCQEEEEVELDYSIRNIKKIYSECPLGDENCLYCRYLVDISNNIVKCRYKSKNFFTE